MQTGDVVTCYRPTGPEELRLVADTGYAKWPPRLPEQPIFYPVTNRRYAEARQSGKDARQKRSLSLRQQQEIQEVLRRRRAGGRIQIVPITFKPPRDRSKGVSRSVDRRLHEIFLRDYIPLEDENGLLQPHDLNALKDVEP